MSSTRVRAIIEVEGRYLVVRNSSSPNFWCLPGGKAEPGEDIVAAIKREILEETGIEAKVGNLVFIHQFKTRKGYGLPEFFFHVANGHDFLDIDSTTHDTLELEEIGFRYVKNLNILPEFLKTELPSLAATSFSGPTQVRIVNN